MVLLIVEGPTITRVVDSFTSFGLYLIVVHFSYFYTSTIHYNNQKYKTMDLTNHQHLSDKDINGYEGNITLTYMH